MLRSRIVRSGNIFTERIHRCAPVVSHPDAVPVRLKSPAQEQSQRLVVFGNQ